MEWGGTGAGRETVSTVGGELIAVVSRSKEVGAERKLEGMREGDLLSSERSQQRPYAGSTPVVVLISQLLSTPDAPGMAGLNTDPMKE